MSDEPTVMRPVAKQGEPGPTDASPSRPTLDLASVHRSLQDVMQSAGDRQTVLKAFREVIMSQTGAVGVGMLTQKSPSGWKLVAEDVSGRMPTRADFVKKFGNTCDTVLTRGTIQMERFLGLESIYAPIPHRAETMVLLVLSQKHDTPAMLLALEATSIYLSLYLDSSQATDSDDKVRSLAAIIDLISRLESQETVAEACHVVVNELVRHLNATQVAVGTLSKGRLHIDALSGTTDLRSGSQVHDAMEMALNESILRDEIGVYPATDDGQSHLLVAHRQLCNDVQCEGVLTTPLTTPDGDVVGALLITGAAEKVQDEQLNQFVRTAAPSIASALLMTKRMQRGRLSRAGQIVARHYRSSKSLTWIVAGLIVTGLLVMPIRYRVRCGCETQPQLRRFAVAPFEGQIDTAHAKPGDTVRQGDLLASMDGQSLRFELASVMAQQRQAEKQREIELAQRNVTTSLVSQLEAQRLASRASLLLHQLQQLEIRAPIDGVVLSGSAEQATASAVGTGDVVYEIGSLGQMRIEIAIPAEEIAHVSVGQPLRIWLTGLSSQSFDAMVERIRPESELGEGRNVFIATVTLDNEDDRLRPGMKGTVRIDCEYHSLAWNLFHGPWDYLVSRLTWW